MSDAIKLLAAGMLLLGLCACSDSGDNLNAGADEAVIQVGAASRSLLPTVSGGRDYLDDAPGWPPASELNPDDPGVFIPVWDQGRVDVGNGNSWASWVHDDIRATAVALEREGQQLILVSSNTYMHLKSDVDEIVNRVQAALPGAWSDAHILVASAHNHHGPETAFGPNFDWYEMAADQIVDAVVEAVSAVQPASATIAAGEHYYGVADQRDPRIYDGRLNVMGFSSIETGDSIAVVVQWNAHPEVTLGWEPPAEAANLDEVCALRDWEGSDCTAEDRYFSGDFVGVLETRMKDAIGGEVAFLNGALGVLTGPLHASTWRVDEDHPVGDGKTVPDGAVPLASCDNKSNPYECQSFAKTESTGTELANAVLGLLESAGPMVIESIDVRTREFYSRVTNLGFRALAGEGELGWQPMQVYNCEGKPFTDDNCVNTGLETIVDPVLQELGYVVAKGDVLKTRVTHVDFGDVGMLFMPGEVPSELVIGLPDDFSANPEKYNRNPDEHAVGEDYVIPGYYLSLVDESITFTVGLGTDEVGYFVPASDYRLQCLDLVLGGVVPGASCKDLADRGLIESPTYVGGLTCQKVFDDVDFAESLGADAPAVRAVCFYGQMVGAEIIRPAGHYEETNSAGWDLVDDLWAATVALFEEKNAPGQ